MESCRDSRRRPQQRKVQRKKKKKMIYRKWSLLSGPPVILGGAVVAAVALGILVQNVTKGEQKKNVSSNNLGWAESDKTLSSSLLISSSLTLPQWKAVKKRSHHSPTLVQRDCIGMKKLSWPDEIFKFSTQPNNVVVQFVTVSMLH
ncbi:hypothetical protein HID58_010301 [Brassica napus]|uniref:Uncharacterized protein n=1 Tax=Brassica napus TaxID=3708 RepID=A0ABQ8DV00_BRANA|nr:hypothetical protein HID58_010301 [Brassica napus]